MIGLSDIANLITAGTGLADWATGTTSSRSYSYQRRLQRHQFEFEKEMFERQVELANTAHQREIQDLQKAGLNPVLSATGGNGAPMATAGVGSGGGQVDAGPTGADIGNLITNAITAREQAKQAKAQTEYMEKWQPEIAKSEINKNKAEANKASAEASLTEQTEDINEPDEETAKALKWWNSTWAGKAINVMGDAVGKISPFTASAIQYGSARKIANAVANKPKTELIEHFDKKGNRTGHTIKRKH